MSHELLMSDEKRVLNGLENVISRVNHAIDVIETAAGISNMNLPIGGLDKKFVLLLSMVEPMKSARVVVEEQKDRVEQFIREFKRANDL